MNLQLSPVLFVHTNKPPCNLAQLGVTDRYCLEDVHSRIVAGDDVFHSVNFAKGFREVYEVGWFPGLHEPVNNIVVINRVAPF